MSSSRNHRKHHNYIMWFWKRDQTVALADNWLGCLEHPNGEKSYFKTLDELLEMLQDDGWHPNFGLMPKD